MATVFDRLQELKEKSEKERALGGPKQIEKQHKSGKLTARERLDILFDPGSFYHMIMHTAVVEEFYVGTGLLHPDSGLQGPGEIAQVMTVGEEGPFQFRYIFFP